MSRYEVSAVSTPTGMTMLMTFSAYYLFSYWVQRKGVQNTEACQPQQSLQTSKCIHKAWKHSKEMPLKQLIDIIYLIILKTKAWLPKTTHQTVNGAFPERVIEWFTISHRSWKENWWPGIPHLTELPTDLWKTGCGVKSELQLENCAKATFYHHLPERRQAAVEENPHKGEQENTQQQAVIQGGRIMQHRGHFCPL